MASPYVITSPCIGTTDRACVDVCPVQCIYELDGDRLVSRAEQDGEVVNEHPPHPDLQFLHGAEMLYINPDECTSCDACRPECPVDAIFAGDDVPAPEQEFVDLNRFIFADAAP